MLEFFASNQEQRRTEKPIFFNLIAKLREALRGLNVKNGKDSQPKKIKEKISPEIINFNQEQIHLAMERIREQLKKTKKKKGVIACEELT